MTINFSPLPKRLIPKRFTLSDRLELVCYERVELCYVGQEYGLKLTWSEDSYANIQSYPITPYELDHFLLKNVINAKLDII